MTGHEVLHPMGWDAFGMPAENAAMEKKVHPGSWTRENIATMRAQLKKLGFALDWSRELATCEPDYYGQEQALFLDMMEAGLVYRKESAVNWDPVDMTVLANEQVIDGKGWRSGAPVEKRKLSQWFLRITQFADDLLAGLKTLDQWPEKVRLMQENWIGKSVGLAFRFKLDEVVDGIGEVEVFSTRPDTIFGASFAAIAADHPLALALEAKNPALAAFAEECRHTGTAAAEVETQEKKGYDTGLSVIHPFTGRKLPLFVANFVLMDYGTGAVMAVPGHDQRDLDFARKYMLPVERVVAAEGDEDKGIGEEAYTGPGRLVNSDFLNGMGVEEAKAEVIRRAERRLGHRHHRLPVEGLGRVAPALLGDADPGHPLRGLRGRGRAQGPAARGAAGGCQFRHSGQSAGSPSDLEACRLPEVRQGGAARDGHAGHVCGLQLVFHPLRQPAQGQALRPRDGREMAARRPIYRRRGTCDPAPALRPFLDPRAPAYGAAGLCRAVHRPVHAGHGDA
jgi:isoleucyl-tRNA synthetase